MFCREDVCEDSCQDELERRTEIVVGGKAPGKSKSHAAGPEP